MSATSSVPIESKTARKRKQKPEATAASIEGISPVSEQAPPNIHSPAPDTNGTDSANESPFIKELGRQIRNIHKKLAASSKADAVVKENPSKSIDELVAEKKLNADQKNQLLKKPGLHTQLAQLEDQLKQFQSFAQELQERYSKEKAEIIDSHAVELTKAREEAATEASSGQSESLSTALKTVTQFLHAAASKRQSEDADSDEGRAFEGALLLVYQGNEASLTTLQNLVEGSNDKVPDVQGEPLDFTFAQIKSSASREAQEHTTSTEAEVDEVQPLVDAAPASADSGIESDPTITHAGMTELGDTNILPIRSENALSSDVEELVIPEQASTTAEAANAVAEATWDPQASMTTDMSTTNEEWVQVPRDPAETDTGIAATPAAAHGSSNWAEEVGAAAEENPKAENDGFEQVKRERGRGRGRGGRGDYRGRGRGGGGRGDGQRGGRGGPARARGGAPRGEKSSS